MSTDSQHPDGGIIRDIARERCGTIINQAFNHNSPALVDALPAMGKSSGVVRWAAQTGKPLTIFTARHTLYSQYEDWCREQGLTSFRIPSYHYDCPCVGENNEYGDDWKARLIREYNNGRTGEELHNRAISIFGESLPCQTDGECPYLQRREYSPTDYDVLIGHYTHAYSEKPSEKRYVVFDEFPEDGFLAEYDSSTVSTAISAYLQHEDSLPYEDYKDLQRNRWHPNRRNDVSEWIEEQSQESGRDGSLLDRGSKLAHANAPLLTLALLKRVDLENRWGYAELGGGRIAVQSRYSEKMTIFSPPQVEGAIQIIALDGTPRVEKWQLILGDDLEQFHVLTKAEKSEYLRTGLGLQLIQTTSDEKPYAGGPSITPEKDMALLEAITKREGQPPALISTKKAIDEYKGLGLTEITSKCQHYSNLKGSNEFEEERLGIVIGTPRQSDEEVEKWAALFGESVSIIEGPDGKRTTGMGADYGPFGNIFLKSMREDRVLQAVMRFGRKETDGVRGATVYVHTAALPIWTEIDKQTAKIYSWKHGEYDGMDQVITAILDRKNWKTEEWRSDEIAERTEISVQQVRTHLRKRLSEQFQYIGYERRGRGRPYYWHNICLEMVGEHGHVSFEAPNSQIIWDSKQRSIGDGPSSV